MIWREVGRVPTLCRGADVAQGDGAREEDPERESHAVDGAKGGGGSAVSGRLNVGHSFPHALSLMENLVRREPERQMRKRDQY